MNEYGLSLGSTVISNYIVVVEKFSLDKPALHEIVIHSINCAGSDDSGVWENIKNFLLSDVLGSQINGRAVWSSTSGRKVNQSLDLWISSTCLGNSSCNIDIDILSILKGFYFSSGPNQVNDDV